MTRLRSGLALAAAAVAVVLLVLVVTGRSTPPGDEATLQLRDPQGNTVGPGDLTGQPWVAVLLPGSVTPGAASVLEALAARLPAATPRVALVPGSDGLHRDREGMDEPDRDLDAAAAALPASWRHWVATPTSWPALLAWLQADASRPAALLVLLDGRGRIHARYPLNETRADSRETGAALLGELEFLHGLRRRPRLHALLNGTSGVLLLLGLACIRARRVGLHLACMLAAILVSCAFLASYLQYHHYAGSVAFTGQGWIRLLYFAVLLSHTLLAALVVPLALVTLLQAARRRFDRHRRIARWTFPIWVYVSATGVLIYLMLYVWFPGG